MPVVAFFVILWVINSLFYSKPIVDGKLYELRFGHREIRLHGVSYYYFVVID